MPALKSLSFTALPKSVNDPVHMRRARFTARLEEQQLLLKDPNHVRTVQRWTKVDGERQATSKQQAVRPWLEDRLLRTGGHVHQVRCQAHRVREGQGWHRGRVQGQASGRHRQLIAAVRAGELDDLFSQAAKTGVVGKPRKAA